MEPQQHLKQNLANARQSLLMVFVTMGVMVICLSPLVYYFALSFEDSLFDSDEIPGWVGYFTIIATICFIIVCWALPDSIKAWRNYSKTSKSGEAVLSELEIIDKHLYVHSVPGGKGITYSYFFTSNEGSWRLPASLSPSYYEVFPGAILKAAVLKAPGFGEIAEFKTVKTGNPVNRNKEGIILEKTVSEVNITNYTGDQIIYNKQFLSEPKNYYFLFHNKVIKVDLKTFQDIAVGSEYF